jgi:hypothetical protein
VAQVSDLLLCEADALVRAGPLVRLPVAQVSDLRKFNASERERYQTGKPNAASIASNTIAGLSLPSTLWKSMSR